MMSCLAEGQLEDEKPGTKQSPARENTYVANPKKNIQYVTEYL